MFHSFSANLLNTLSNGGFTSLCGIENIFLTTHDAVSHAYLKPHVSSIFKQNSEFNLAIT